VRILTDLRLTRWLVATTSIAITVSLLACHDIAAPALPADATPFQARPEYALWWRATEQCSGLTGSLAAIQWYSVPGETFTLGADSLLDGTWFSKSNSILLAENSIDDGSTVRHEMLHALIGRGGHPAEMFRVRCGGYVGCSGPCATEVGSFPDPPPEAAVVAPQSLLLSISANPMDVTDSTANWTLVTLSVTNPFPYPVWVALTTFTSNPDYAIGDGFGMGNGFPYPSIGSFEDFNGNRFGFAANQTRRFAFDASVGSGPAYSMSLWGYFNSDTTQRITVWHH
jgi:hypothetical protein